MAAGLRVSHALGSWLPCRGWSRPRTCAARIACVRKFLRSLGLESNRLFLATVAAVRRDSCEGNRRASPGRTCNLDTGFLRASAFGE